MKDILLKMQPVQFLHILINTDQTEQKFLKPIKTKHALWYKTLNNQEIQQYIQGQKRTLCWINRVIEKIKCCIHWNKMKESMARMTLR